MPVTGMEKVARRSAEQGGQRSEGGTASYYAVKRMDMAKLTTGIECCAYLVAGVAITVAPFAGGLGPHASGLVFWQRGRALIAYAEGAAQTPGRRADRLVDLLRRAAARHKRVAGDMAEY